jgi:hypothetical protein
MLVGVVLVSELGTENFGTEVVVDTGEVLGHCTGALVVGVIAGGGREIKLPTGVATIHAEERGSAGGLQGVVVGREFGKMQLFSPIILVIVDVHPEVLLHYRVDSLCLTVCLRVEGRGKSSIDSEAGAEASPEVGCELRSSVRYNGQWQPMQPEYMLQEEVGESLGIDCRMAWNQMAGLGQAVHHYPNGIVLLVGQLGYSGDEVHRDILPWLFRDGQRAENSKRGVAAGSRTLAGVAIPYVSLDVPTHLVPMVLTVVKL